MARPLTIFHVISSVELPRPRLLSILSKKGHHQELSLIYSNVLILEDCLFRAQEIRHALNQGKVTEFLERLANLKEFKKATANSIRDDRMADRECVLRFLAFTITPYAEYKVNDFDSFLNDRMAEINKMPDQRLENLEQQFIRAMRAMLIIFGREAFRKPRKGNTPRFPINKALFESWSVNISQLDDHQVVELTEKKEMVKEKFLNLMNDREFNGAISQGTGNIKKVKHRFRAIEDLILEVLS